MEYVLPLKMPQLVNLMEVLGTTLSVTIATSTNLHVLEISKNVLHFLLHNVCLVKMGIFVTAINLKIATFVM